VEGQWVHSDYGWYWQSEEPWAWATYHYGRWVLDNYYGWVWVPDVEWAPSWVAWREGGGYIGWAPLPPRCRWGGDRFIEFHDDWCLPSWYVFVGNDHFCDYHHRSSVIMNRTFINETIIHKTVNITRIENHNNVVINHGPAFTKIQQFNGDRLQTAVTTHGPAAITGAHGGGTVYRPPELQLRHGPVFRESPAHEPKTTGPQPVTAPTVNRTGPAESGPRYQRPTGSSVRPAEPKADRVAPAAQSQREWLPSTMDPRTRPARESAERSYTVRQRPEPQGYSSHSAPAQAPTQHYQAPVQRSQPTPSRSSDTPSGSGRDSSGGSRRGQP